MEFLVLIGITLLCYGWIGHHERIARSLQRARHASTTRYDRRM